MHAIHTLGRHMLLVSVALVLPGCSAIGPFTEHEKALINKPMPKTVAAAKMECNVLRAHYDMLLYIIAQRDESGWEDESEKQVMVTDAWADYHRARRIGCSGWE